ncbi:MAG: oligosaccharide flippase family protein, partial [Nanoarchaeota archaeon]
MGTARTIYKNTLYLGTAEIVSRLLQFVVMLYAARLLSKEHFGKFNFALSLSLIAIVLADLGINTLLIREVSRNKKLAGKYFVNAFFTKAVLSLITYFIIVAVLNLLNYPQDTRQIVYIIWLFTILSTFTELFYSIFRAFEMMQYD